MEVYEEISVQTNPSELGFHQPQSTDNVPKTSELGFPELRASSNGDSDSAASDLALREQVVSLALKGDESEGSPKSDSEAAREMRIGGHSENEVEDETDRELGEKKSEEAREESIESDRELGDELEVPVEKELIEGIGERSDSDNWNEVAVKNEGESLKENEVNNGGDEPEKREERIGVRKYQYPVRPEAEDCAFYLKTGNCKFGSNCKFNHPVRKKSNHQAARERAKEKETEKEESAEKSSQSECKFYLRSGGCKFGKACKYNHTRGKMAPAVLPVLEFNFVGLPIRVGEKECPYYMRTGSCKYGAHCRFNHPDPTDEAVSDPPVAYGNGPAPLQGGSQSNMPPSWTSPRSMNESAPPAAPFLLVPPAQVAPSQNSEWNGYQAPVYLPPERNMPPPPPYAMNNLPPETNIYKHPMNNLPPETNIYKHPMSQKQVDDYPERPGQPDCSYFLKTGDCKFKSNCKYNHPKNRGLMSTPCTLSDKGLPLRPDQNICAHYSRYGICKYGPSCKYDHSPLKPTSTVSGGDNQPPYSQSSTMEGAGMTRSGSRTEVTIQQ